MCIPGAGQLSTYVLSVLGSGRFPFAGFTLGIPLDYHSHGVEDVEHVRVAPLKASVAALISAIANTARFASSMKLVSSIAPSLVS